MKDVPGKFVKLIINCGGRIFFSLLEGAEEAWDMKYCRISNDSVNTPNLNRVGKYCQSSF